MNKRKMKIIFTATIISLAIVILHGQQDNQSHPAFYDIHDMLEDAKPEVDTYSYLHNWTCTSEPENFLINRIGVPSGYIRYEHRPKTFEHWLQRLPIKKGHPNVKLYDGFDKWNQSAHCYVVDIETGSKDLQQCADALIRLRSEYLYETEQYDDIAFNYTNGARVPYSKWRKGYMPVPKSGGVVNWVTSSKAGKGYDKFKSFLIQVYNYAGTHSLDNELPPKNFFKMSPGDIIIEGGFPGHGIMIVDMASHHRTGEKLFLLAQSYMPAQDIQILRNYNNTNLSPWYSLKEIDYIVSTPEWEFDTDDLRSWY